MEVKTIKDVFDFFDCGIVNIKYNTNFIVYMEMIQSFLLNNEEINSEYLFKLLQQSNDILLKLITCKNSELRNGYFEMKDIILESIQENNQDVF